MKFSKIRTFTQFFRDFRRLRLFPLTVLLFALFVECSQAATRYVWTNSPADGPGTAWTNAFHQIQPAIDASASNDTVLVTNGVYDTGGLVTPGYACSNRVVITNYISVRSVNGPEVTIIKGAEAPSGGCGTGAFRGVYMSAGELCGFTITNGYTYGGGHFQYDQSGGGVNMYGGTAIISNCVVTGNGAYAGGGGILGGGAVDCTIAYNVCITAGSGCGGGTENTILSNCRVMGNRAFMVGGGVEGGSAYHCVIISNRAMFGGGAASANLENCLIKGNSAGNSGGGVDYGGKLFNCTVTENSANSYCGGLGSVSTARNCIVWGNVAPEEANYETNVVMLFSCTTPLPPGDGNITNAPGFLDAAAGDYYLAYGSPCIDSGTNLSFITRDLDGTTRPLDGNFDGTNDFDMGCYEYNPATADSDGEGLVDADEVNIYGTSPTNSDTDADLMTDWDEAVAATDGTNSNSVFHVIAMDLVEPDCITFSCTNSRTYSLEYTTSLTSGQWYPVSGANNITGDASGVMAFTGTVDAATCLYRVSVSSP